MIDIVSVEEKTPDEILGYRFDLTKIEAFGKYDETFTGLADTNWGVYDVTDTTINLASTMVYASSVNTTDLWMQVDVTGGTDGSSYYLKGVVTATSGRKYAVYARLNVRNPIG